MNGVDHTLILPEQPDLQPSSAKFARRPRWTTPFGLARSILRRLRRRTDQRSAGGVLVGRARHHDATNDRCTIWVALQARRWRARDPRHHLVSQDQTIQALPLSSRLVRRTSYNGSTSASQAENAGSIPVVRSKHKAPGHRQDGAQSENQTARITPSSCPQPAHLRPNSEL